tara:strand:- start:842 stop:1195 length:354 start_codon:yes stop_codon:yes gene_type:complete
MNENILEKRLEEIRKITNDYAKAKSRFSYLDYSRHIVLADLMRHYYEESKDKTSIAKCEMMARSSQKYKEHIKHLSDAEHLCIKLNWELKIIQMKFESWKTNVYSINQEAKNYGFKK